MPSTQCNAEASALLTSITPVLGRVPSSHFRGGATDHLRVNHRKGCRRSKTKVAKRLKLRTVYKFPLGPQFSSATLVWQPLIWFGQPLKLGRQPLVRQPLGGIPPGERNCCTYTYLIKYANDCSLIFDN